MSAADRSKFLTALFIPEFFGFLPEPTESAIRQHNSRLAELGNEWAEHDKRVSDAIGQVNATPWITMAEIRATREGLHSDSARLLAMEWDMVSGGGIAGQGIDHLLGLAIDQLNLELVRAIDTAEKVERNQLKAVLKLQGYSETNAPSEQLTRYEAQARATEPYRQALQATESIRQAIATTIEKRREIQQATADRWQIVRKHARQELLGGLVASTIEPS